MRACRVKPHLAAAMKGGAAVPRCAARVMLTRETAAGVHGYLAQEPLPASGAGTAEAVHRVGTLPVLAARNRGALVNVLLALGALETRLSMQQL